MAAVVFLYITYTDIVVHIFHSRLINDTVRIKPIYILRIYCTISF